MSHSADKAAMPAAWTAAGPRGKESQCSECSGLGLRRRLRRRRRAECDDFLAVYRRHVAAGGRFDHVAILSPHLALEFVQGLLRSPPQGRGRGQGQAVSGIGRRMLLLHLFYKGGRDPVTVLEKVAALLAPQPAAAAVPSPSPPPSPLPSPPPPPPPSPSPPPSPDSWFIKSMGNLYGGKTLWYVEFALPGGCR